LFSLAFGNEYGVAVIDWMQKVCLLNIGTPDLYGIYQYSIPHTCIAEIFLVVFSERKRRNSFHPELVIRQRPTFTVLSILQDCHFFIGKHG